MRKLFKNPEPQRPDFKEVCKNLKIDENRVIDLQLVKFNYTQNIKKYLEIEKLTGVPSELICALHYREMSLSWNGCLHNGEKILGTGKKTSLVPKGRGPFDTFEQAAIDALFLKKNLFPKEWNLATCCEFAERYNGLGYRSKIGDKGEVELSPYCFAGTNAHDETGKFVRDGKYDPNAKEAQLGVAAILLILGMESL